MAKNKPTEASEVGQEDSMTIGEIGDSKPQVQKAARDAVALQNEFETEAFMNQILEIRVAADATQGAYDVCPPGVNGVNQPIIRGVIQKVKRKYVEALARSRETTYQQETPDPRTPENHLMRPITVISFPFEVLKDPHPRGAEWLQQIIDQP